MATQQEIDQLRSLVGDTDLTDDQLGDIFDASQCMNQAVANVWGQKAAMYAPLVDISEAGSSRSMGQLYKNALEMSKYYYSLGCPGVTPPTAATRTQTRAIVRP
jgi:hypothetical protein